MKLLFSNIYDNDKKIGIGWKLDISQQYLVVRNRLLNCLGVSEGVFYVYRERRKLW